MIFNFFFLDMEDSEWILITDATPKKKSTPKAVPVFHSKSAPSFQQPLKKGGKPPPVFARPDSLTAPSTLSRVQPGPHLGVDSGFSVVETNLKRKTSVSQSISAPLGKRSTAVVPKASGISADLLARWMLIVNSVGALSAVWEEYHLSAQFEVHCKRLIERFAASTLFKYIDTLQGVFTILTDFNMTWADVGSRHLSDLLQIAHEGRSSDGFRCIDSHQGSAMGSEVAFNCL